MAKLRRQLCFLPIMKDARNHLALREDKTASARRGKIGLRGFPIASTKSDYNPLAHVGYKRASGVTYLRCPFHHEKTPSCVVYPKGWKATWEPVTHTYLNGRSIVFSPRPSLWSHFHCYGCSKSGSIRKLCEGLRNPVKPSPYAWLHEPDDPNSPVPF